MLWAYLVLAPLSRCYPCPSGRLSTCYSPVRHCTQDRSPFLVRLACVKHAASVRSEPGSNSPVIFLNQMCLIHVLFVVLFLEFWFPQIYLCVCYSVFKDQVFFAAKSRYPLAAEMNSNE